MKNIYSLVVTSAIALSLTGCTGSSSNLSQKANDKESLSLATAFKLDEKKVCNVEKLGVAKVLANANMYNAMAKKEGVEFRRLGVNNTDLIKAAEEGLKTGAKTVKPKNYKGKVTKTAFTIEYATHRACVFGLSALQLKHEAKSTWREAVPGDKFKY